ncbi:hypothetical protein DL89DRAFT_86165 [Linderina pennispora]|uniref:Uncharacterized protein n=1 Tax=Linderina pennispora TaxID=61395 RepID=A0A1Y1WI24_9FUNG|nr:uncharacterized protein DL89DRAFT_86165 [Linderina pennispora]ORX73015.1 hypothetical protein DL89DRAFT_86165 [Linderina pennispora]
MLTTTKRVQPAYPSWPKSLVSSICLLRSASLTVGRLFLTAFKKSDSVRSGLHRTLRRLAGTVHVRSASRPAPYRLWQ